MLLEAETINCRVPQGSILGHLLFLLYVNDIPLALSDSLTYLNADDTIIFYQYKAVTEIENVSDKEVANGKCEWFVNNKMSIHTGEYKTKCILSSKEKNKLELTITYDNNRIKQ